MSERVIPTLDFERALLDRGFARLGAMDEVGRGALAGPVSVGVVVIDAHVREVPEGVRDSKQLSAPRRERLAPLIREWALDSAVGHASAAVIDEVGIVAAMAFAAMAALESLTLRPEIILLDGSHDWLSACSPGARVETKVRADTSCAAVSAASVIAKVARDELMVELASEFSAYAWESNKGYASESHLEALRTFGECEQHRRSWNLPGRQATLWAP